MNLIFIPLWDIDLHWATAAPLLAKPLAKQHAMTLESVREDCRRGKFHLWLIPEQVAFVTEIQQFPAERIAMIVLCGGSGLEEWSTSADETLTRYAQAMGCQALMIVGREGWSRVMPAYKIQDVIMRKDL